MRLFVAGDVVRAFKLACNPSQPASATGFFIDAIEGFDSFCAALGKVAPTISAMRQFVDTSTLRSVRAPDDSTLIVMLRAPRPDFLNVAALPYLAPVPREYLDYIPDGPEFRQHTISIGPYRLRRYLPNREFVYERNPVWTAASDPLRPAYVDRVIVTLGVDLQLQMLQIEAGTADLSPDPVRGADVGPMLASGNPVLWLSPTGPGGGSMSFLAINRVGPDRDAVLGKLEVRRALALAVDKAALVQVSAGPQVASPLRQAAPSFLAGHRPSDREYATPGDRGDASAARAMLQRAGYPPDRPLRIAYPIGTDAVAQVLQASFAKAGLRVELKPLLTGEYYGRLLSDIGNARRGEWDLAVVSWYPDWYGKSNGRTVLPTLFDGRTVGKNVTNYGGFSADSVNLAIDRAANAVDTPTADSLWHEMSLLLSREVALIPLLETKYPWPRSRRVRGCTWDSYSLGCNLTNLWLARPPMGEAAR